MKLKALILALSLIATFGGFLYAEEGCSSCSAHTEHAGASEAKIEDSCPDGTCATVAPAVTEEKVAKTQAPVTLTTAALKTLIDSGVAPTILDARSGKYDDGNRIAGAQSLNADSSVEEISKILPKKEALIVTYCSNLECPASHKLYTRLQSLGYTNLIEYPEGIQGWLEAGNPVTSSK